MLKKIALNIGSGYALKIVQTLCSLATVPLLVREEGLGLSGYGQLAVVLSFAAFLSMMFDGVRLVTSKRIGQSTPLFARETQLLTRQTCKLLLPTVFAVILFHPQLFALVGIQNQSERLIYLLALCFVIEQLSYTVEQYFHSRVETLLINITLSVEVIVRLVAIAAVFHSQQGSIADYFLIFGLTSLARFVILWAMLIRNERGAELPAQQLTSHASFFTLAKEALPLSLTGIALFLVFRLSIILTSKYLSDEIAAVFAIIFFTLRGYLNQAFVAVIRPMVIPLVSQIEVKNLDRAKLDRYHNMICLYEAAVMLSIMLLAITCPLWLGVWLGSQFTAYQNVFSFGIIILGIEAAMSLKGMILIAQGHGNHLTRLSLAWGIFYTVGIWLLQVSHGISLTSMTLAIAAFIFLYNGASTNMLFRRNIAPSRISIYPIVIIGISAAIVYGLLSEPFTPKAMALIVSVWLIATLLLATHNREGLKLAFGLLKGPKI